MEGRVEAPGHLDTVRALHQTVVSLRTALELSKNELKELKEKYQKHSSCLDYADVIEKLTLENHILRRRIIDTNYEEDSNTKNITLEVTYSPRQNVDEIVDSEVVIKTATTEVGSTAESLEPDPDDSEEYKYCTTEKLNEIAEESETSELNVTAEFTQNESVDEESPVEPHSQVISFTQPVEDQPTFKTKLELLSKFDVRIKVRTIKEGTIISSTTSDSESTTSEKRDTAEKEESRNFYFEEKHVNIETVGIGNKVDLKTESSENIKMAVPNEADVKTKPDKFDVQVRITSEENLIVKENIERTRRKDTLNLDVDDLSLRSMSEGDNSVFSEGVTPVEPCVERGGSDNESEEVDDIELIFTTDESKDMSNLQEDLVSIKETDQWGPSSASTHSTPVLIKFHTLDPDFQPGADLPPEEKNPIQNIISGSSLRMKRVSLPSDKDIRRVAFNGKDSLDLPGRGILKSYENRSDVTLYKRSPNTSTRRLNSVDSLTCEYNRALSFDNTKSSSFDLGSSMDMLRKEESVDSFRGANLGHRFSVFAETDLTKCGISEDDLAGNLNVRRNTCPNPFQYRPLPLGPRGRGSRPVRRAGGGARRDGAAQTDLSALPERWTSDGHLAYKPTPLPTVPQRVGTAGMTGIAAQGTGGRLAVPVRGVRRGDDTRRLLLSDLGFTSMIPELSRSADPVWALGRLAADAELSPQPSYTSKYLSRGPSLSTDRSSDWTQRACFSPMCMGRACAGSLPDVRAPLYEAPPRTRSVHTLAHDDYYSDAPIISEGTPFVPATPSQLRAGHRVRLIAPTGRLAQGRVRYVGIAGGSAANSSIMIGAEFPAAQYPGLPRNDGTYKGRRYFLTPPQYTALFVPFTKVVMAWTN